MASRLEKLLERATDAIEKLDVRDRLDEYENREELLDPEGTPVQAFADLLGLVAATVRCPEHGPIDPDEITATVEREEGTMHFEIHGFCCEKLDELAEERLAEFRRELKEDGGSDSA